MENLYPQENEKITSLFQITDKLNTKIKNNNLELWNTILQKLKV